VRACLIVVVSLAAAAGIPDDAFAQAIAGAVQDTSGFALPDVTVHAESSALIEKVRTSVTDGAGQYRIEDLRPGIYTITFTREGFRPQVRVDEDAVRRAYEDAWRARDDRPEFDAVAPDLRTRLAEEDLKQRIEAWVKELRAGAEVRYNVGSPPAAAEADGS